MKSLGWLLDCHAGAGKFSDVKSVRTEISAPTLKTAD